MSIRFQEYLIKEESYLKAQILTRGVIFTESAVQTAIREKAKGQNLVYNMPVNASASRPQELYITNIKDDYSTVVSCVAPNTNSTPVEIDTDKNEELVANIDGETIDNIIINYVSEPEYYKKYLTNGECVKKYVSACGFDELNIIPWKGCAISKGCRFCGINNFISKDEISAFDFKFGKEYWNKIKGEYLNNLKESLVIAKEASCYNEHMHVILIAGNLHNDNLDLESEIFAEISSEIFQLVNKKSAEGIILVITPPKDLNLLTKLKNSGISKVVFNLEAIQENYFKKYCPGKAELGYDYFVKRLEKAVEVFGKGNVWSNLVFGLEPKEDTLKKCSEFAQKGIVISANILHLDKGNSLECKVPSIYDSVDFFYRLEQINKNEGLLPYYCSKALRTSLSNETHDLRIIRDMEE